VAEVLAIAVLVAAFVSDWVGLPLSTFSLESSTAETTGFEASACAAEVEVDLAPEGSPESLGTELNCSEFLLVDSPESSLSASPLESPEALLSLSSSSPAVVTVGFSDRELAHAAATSKLNVIIFILAFSGF
jgi:hypothetical protein